MGDSTTVNPVQSFTTSKRSSIGGLPDHHKAVRVRPDMSDSNNPSPSPEPEDDEAKPSLPIQKRRRVTRACDECRRKKIKCDGTQPCTHCTVYSYECTYDQPSNRRRNPAPQYIEALEQRLQKAEAVLRAVLPGVDIDDPKFDAHGVDQILESSRASKTGVAAPQKPEDDSQMHSMVDQTGSLDLDDTGNWDYHGHTSGYMFVSRFRAKFGTKDLIKNSKSPENKNLSHVLDSPKSVHSSPFDPQGGLVTDLPTRELALKYCRAAIDDGCALTRPLHIPTFFQRLNSMYDTDSDQWNNEQMHFLPLLYAVMALGCLFTQGGSDGFDQRGYESAIEQGFHWFHASKKLLDITDCRDLLSLQTVVFMIFFLQGSAKLATCYSYIGIALRGCCRLGMHRKVTTRFNPIEQEERKRCFWLVRKLDTYVGTMLGLPQMLSEDDVDQELPAEVHDDCITAEGMQPMPAGVFPLMKATNSHTKLMFIMKRVLQYVYPLKPSVSGSDYTVSHSRIRELERDLQTWMDELPAELRPSGDADLSLSRVQQLLRMSYAYVQMMMYRPFLHYVSPACQTGATDKRSFACAAACVSVARNIVHITSEMRRRGLLGGAYWFVMYITYFAILSLVYFVLENPDSTTSKDILRDAREGRDTLASLARRSFAADRCTLSLNGLFEELPDKLKERRASLQVMSSNSRKRGQSSLDPIAVQQANAPGNLRNIATGLSGNFGPPNRVRTLPNEYLTRVPRKPSLPNSPSATSTSFNIHTDSRPQTLNGSTFSSPTAGSPAVLDWSVPQMQQGNFPDLKNVMFPSDNPFAYGNQAISTLEDSSFGGLRDMNFGVEQFNNTTESDFPASQGLPNPGQQMPDFNMSDFQPAGNAPQYQQQRQGTQSFTSDLGAGHQSIYNLGRDNAVNKLESMQAPPQNQQSEDYWTQNPSKGPFTGRTGFTPGGHGVNLDELFGGGNGWGPMNMGAENFGVPLPLAGEGNHGQPGGMHGMWESGNWQ